MKLLFLLSSLNAGGAERVATTLCNAWARRGDEVTLVPTFSGGGSPAYPLDQGVRLVYLSSLAGIAPGASRQQLRRLLALRRLIRQQQPDLVLSFLSNVNVAALLATAFTGIPCIVCERSDPAMMPLGPLWRLGCRLLYPRARALTVQTERVARQLPARYPGLRRVAVTPNPLPADILPRPPATGGARRVLLSLGRLAPEKQLGEIIDAFATLSPQFPEWDLHIHGEGPERPRLARQIAEAGLQQRVLLHGATREPWPVLAAADAFVMNSRYEGFPNALLEAMGAGLPCIAADCPSGPRELSADGQDALLFPPGDSAALLAALRRVMGDAGYRAALGERARRGVQARYALPVVLGIWDELFAAVSGGRP